MARPIRGQQPVVIVLIALLLLILLPLAVQQRHSGAWRRIGDVVHPSGDLVTSIQLALAREAAGTRGFLLTRSPEFAAYHMDASAARKRAYAALLEKSPQVGPEFRAGVLRLGELLEPADARLDALYSGRTTPEEYITALPSQHQRFSEVMAATERLHVTLEHVEADLASDIRQVQGLDAALTLALVLLAMSAVLAVAQLNRNYRLAAEREHLALKQSERARADAERRGLEVERTGENWRMLIRGFAHDLKNPLNAAMGFLFLLEQGVMDPLSARQAAALGKVRRSGQVALQLIEDLLSVARTEAGQIELAKVAVDLRDTAHAVVDEYEAAASAKGLRLRVEMPEAFPRVESDPARVEQIVTNLVANAINYTESGEVTLRLAVRQPAPDRPDGWAAVEVSDTGPGLSEEQQREVFHEFQRCGTSGNSSGSGIGLAISSRLARALGGDISVQSAPGRGSAFTLWLPLSRSGSAALQDDSSRFPAAS